MTREELKRQLHLYRRMVDERKQIAEALARVEALLDGPRGPNMDGMPRSSAVSDPTGSVVAQHIALQERYQHQLAEMLTAQMAIEDMIDGLDPLERQLMRYRYIDGRTWEEVCVAINYSWRQTHNIHARALNRLLTTQQGNEAKQ